MKTRSVVLITLSLAAAERVLSGRGSWTGVYCDDIGGAMFDVGIGEELGGGTVEPDGGGFDDGAVEPGGGDSDDAGIDGRFDDSGDVLGKLCIELGIALDRPPDVADVA